MESSEFVLVNDQYDISGVNIIIIVVISRSTDLI